MATGASEILVWLVGAHGEGRSRAAGAHCGGLDLVQDARHSLLHGQTCRHGV